jgi:hypothetical protein
MNMQFLRILSTLLVGALVAFAAPQQPGRQRGPALKPTLVPFFQLDKVAGFPVLQAKREFIEMEALVCEFPPSLIPGLKKPTKAAQVHYGYKKGGIGVIYQMPKQPGLKAEAVVDAMLKSRVFRERKYFKDWSIKAVADPKFLVAVSGTTPEVRDALIRAIGK